MIRLRLGEVLKQRETDELPIANPFQLATATGLPYASVHRLANAGVRRLDLGVLDRICTALGMEPCDLLVREAPKPAKRAKR